MRDPIELREPQIHRGVCVCVCVCVCVYVPADSVWLS